MFYSYSQFSLSHTHTMRSNTHNSYTLSESKENRRIAKLSLVEIGISWFHLSKAHKKQLKCSLYFRLSAFFFCFVQIAKWNFIEQLKLNIWMCGFWFEFDDKFSYIFTQQQNTNFLFDNYKRTVLHFLFSSNGCSSS